MFIEKRYPSRYLTEYIKYYWILEAESWHHEELIIPNGEIQILFHYKQPFQEADKNGNYEKQYQSLICGQITQYKQVLTSASCGIIGVVFYPHTAKFFLPFSMHEITNCSIETSQQIKAFKDLENRIIDCHSNKEQIRLIETVFTQILAVPNITHFQLIQNTIHNIQITHGQLSVSKIIASSGFSERQFQRIFRCYTAHLLKSEIMICQKICDSNM